MRRRAFVLLQMALGCELMAQTPWPPLCIQDVEWNGGVHHTAVAQPIEAPCSPDAPVSITGAADAEFVSGTVVHLTDGFHAGDFSGDGQFHAYIEDALGAPADLVLISPDPSTHIVDDVVHVEKWEKLEVGLRLPQEYQHAIDSFFDHYYSNGTYQAPTIGSLDRSHDLNPYADDSLQLIMSLIDPSGDPRMKWGFYMTEADWSTPNPTIAGRLIDAPGSSFDPYRVRFRFAPDEEGTWLVSLSISAPHTTTPANLALPPVHYCGYSFVCDPSLPDNKGFLHVDQDNKRTLVFDNGDPFFGLGTNMADGRRSNLGLPNPPGDLWVAFVRHDFDVMKESMTQLHSAGGNFFRMFMLRHFFALEWQNLGVYDHYRSQQPCLSASP